MAFDVNGDRKADADILRGANLRGPLCYVPWTGGSQIRLYFGANGDGTADPVYFRPSAGTFLGRLTNGDLLNVQRGVNGDIPVQKRTAS